MAGFLGHLWQILCLVSQCSATRDTVAATPPCSATRFYEIYAWPTYPENLLRLLFVVIFFSLTEAPSPRPHPDPTQHPETDPKRSQTEPKWTEIKPSRVGQPGGCRDGGEWGGGCKGKRKSLGLHLNDLASIRRRFPDLTLFPWAGRGRFEGGVRGACA